MLESPVVLEYPNHDIDTGTGLRAKSRSRLPVVWPDRSTKMSILRPRVREMSVKFLIGCADINLQMLVTDAAHDVTADFVAAKSAGRMSVEKSNFTAGPGERRFLGRERFTR